MCSVAGYLGDGKGRAFVLEALARLEYRGYDSAGFACITHGNPRIFYEKIAGRVSALAQKITESGIDGTVCMGHTRWSTHGRSTDGNAHPHFDCQKTIAVVHNGIIENYHELREQLKEAGHIFHSQTDTEVIPHLLEALLASHKTFKPAIVDLVKRLEGAYAIAAVMQDFPDQMLLIRRRSPLCIGIGDDEMFVSSDVLTFTDRTKKVLFLPDESFAIVRKNLIELYDFSGKPLPLTVQTLDYEWVPKEKGEYAHYMLKEIYEQKVAIHATVNFLSKMSDTIWDHLNLSREQIINLQKLNIVAAGTSWNASRIAQFFFEDIGLIPTSVHLASEFRYKSFFPDKNSLYLMVSQSGETADTLEALRLINSLNLPTAALTNVASSTMVRESGGFLLTQAGPEVAVASTKAFSTQLTALYWLAHRIACEKGIISYDDLAQAEKDLLVAGEILENTIENYKLDILQNAARTYARYKKAIFLGRHVSYPFALEAALKLKEVAYIFSQCYPAGELKHGPLALVDHETPIFLFSHQDPIIYQKIFSNAQEVKARGGHLIVFVFEGQNELKELADYALVIPRVKPLLGPLVMTGIMQFFVYAIAKELGCPIDKPRNLAKSVTVE